ncbi:bifunctional glycosyltransferase/CDP-glycerol:glycerophosphate glycerophosphotransferase [Listeria fleischmannii]|uniref:bifunctional glycosyltransferase/CDP-glycerol:glycerophosphate glycerophosphotransferase n=1 Tax=Listeria fleischmannii TaxID=1069827 RepID=UPI0016279A8D|nr:CDP-glycerol glycerophosphotransferase family protein [Listeria fleischmannii]MBC1419328.1 glycosyltransferase [Listeria fleischmannii]
MSYEIIKKSSLENVLVSIVTPVYNVVTYIDETISSVLKQTQEGIELILVDDGSTDGSYEKIVEYAEQHKNITVIRQENAGPGTARNVGLEVARGQYVSFLDSDDVLPEKAIEFLYQAAISENVGVVTGISVSFNSTRSWFIQGHYQRGVFKKGRKTVVKNPEMMYTLGPCNKLYRFDIVQNLRFPTEIKVGEDQPFVLEAYLASKDIYTVDEIIYNYRAREDSEDVSLSQIVKSNPYKSFSDLLKSIQLSLPLFDKYISNQVMREKTIEYYLSRMLSADLWAAFRGILLEGDASAQKKAFSGITAFIELIPEQIYNRLEFLHRMISYEIVNRYTYIKKEVRGDYLNMIQIAYSKMNPGAMNTILSVGASKEVRASIEAAKHNSLRPILNLLAKRKILQTLKDAKERFVSQTWMNFKRKNQRFYAKRIAFPFYKAFYQSENKIVFLTNKHTKMQDSFLGIYEELLRQKKDYKIIGHLKQPNRSFSELLRLYKDVATAKYIFLDDYYFQLYGTKAKASTEVIQLWHAAGAFKKFGFSSIGSLDSNTEEFERAAHSLYSKVVVSSKEIVPFYADAFHVPEKNVLPLGVPRTDKFFDEDYKEYVHAYFEGKYPLTKGKKIITYAPTFRGGPSERQTFLMQLNIRRLIEKLGDEYIIILKMHPSVTRGVGIPYDLQEQAYNMSKEDINDVLIYTDILITDYSSVVFDFSIMEKPTIFYAYDLEDYLEERNFYYQFEDFVPGPIVRTNDELIEEIKTMKNYDVEKIRAFKNRFFDDTDGCASERIVRELIQ